MAPGASRAVRQLARELSRSNSSNNSPSKHSSPPRRRWDSDCDSDTDDPRGPRSFPAAVKAECWRKAEVVKGRDPERWRKDAIGNVVFRKLTACQGCLCYDFDHVMPYSKGGASTLDNCQVLQTKVNNFKSNRVVVSESELVERSVTCRFSRRDMDAVELAAYGDVVRDSQDGGCIMQ